MKKDDLISIVVPVYNEEHNIPLVFQKLVNVLQPFNYEIIFVDDGSRDKSLEKIKELVKIQAQVFYLSFARNFGHQEALRAGLEAAHGDAVISLDCDMQHPPDLIPQMIQKWREGALVVQTKREDLKGEVSFFKKWTSKNFYRLFCFFSGVKIEEGAADFRLLARQAVDEVLRFKEVDIFYRGLIPWLGLPTTYLSYRPNERFYGQSKYTLRKMIQLALVGISSFSVRPLYLSFFFGLMISFFAFLYIVYAVYSKLFNNTTIAGWASVLVSVLFLGGVQLIMIGILGGYLGRIFLQVKGRPSSVIVESNRRIL